MNEQKLICPLCRNESKRVFQAHGFWLRDCCKCKHRFAEVAPSENHVSAVYGDDYFAGGAAGYADYLAEGKLLRRAGRRYGEKIKKYSGKTGAVLDVGAAAGFILRGFADAGFAGRGVEPNQKMATHAREKLNLDVFAGCFEDFETTQKFDLISLVQVAAHFQEPVKVFEKIARLAKPNGFLLVETWRRDSFTARAFGKSWHEYSPPSVLHWFTKRGLIDFVAKFGFEVVASGRPAKWINAAHAKSLLKFKLGEMPAGDLLAKGLALIPDKLNFPYPAEDLFWALFRKK
jgi:SAM-dependent methyltransferase